MCTNLPHPTLYADHGVPQDTVLGPSLILLYINDIEDSIEHCDVMLFADDTMLYFFRSILEKMVDNVNRGLDSIFSNLCNNDLVPNIKKYDNI